MKNILIIEDNELVREALALSLGAHLKDYAILTARNGEEGVSILRGVSPDLILTDLQMPVLDGFGVIEHRNRSCPQVPVLVMTADDNPEVRNKLNAMGIFQLIVKPFDFDKMTGAISDELTAGPAASYADPVRPAVPM
jgi:two-component system chemotaxis response regulator CheY